MQGPPANTTGWREQGLIHTAALTGMAALANTRIYYTFGDVFTDDFSDEYVFQVPPLAGTNPPSRPTTAILYCDMGRGSTDDTYTWNEYGRPAVAVMEAVGDEVVRGEVDVVFHGGDISYATGIMAVWDFFMNSLSPVASGALYMTTVGNHVRLLPFSCSINHHHDIMQHQSLRIVIRNLIVPTRRRTTWVAPKAGRCGATLAGSVGGPPPPCCPCLRRLSTTSPGECSVTPHGVEPEEVEERERRDEGALILLIDWYIDVWG